MLSKKVFLTGEPNFSAPPVHAARADVRDHLESREGDHRASYAPDRGLQKRRQANTVFREISGAAQFSTFSTASTPSLTQARSHRPIALDGHAAAGADLRIIVPQRLVMDAAIVPEG